MNKNLHEALVTISQLPVDGSIINAIEIAKTALTEPTKPSEYVPLTDDEIKECLKLSSDNKCINSMWYATARTIEQAVLAKLSAPVTAKPQSAKVDELVNDIEVIANLISNSIDITVVKSMANRALAKFRGNDNE